MANKRGHCIICKASPTVKAHLFPRSIMLDMRGDQNHLVSGHLASARLDFPQNGDWDANMLCYQHECIIGSGDMYAIDLIRSFSDKGKIVDNGNGLSVPNHNPDLLLHFIYATIWRFSNSKRHQHLKSTLGVYSDRLLAPLLDRGPYKWEAIVGVSRIETSSAGRIPIAIAPYLNRLDGLRVWHFVLGKLEFYLKTDQRPFDKSWKPFLANGNDPIILNNPRGENIANLPVLRPLLARMITANSAIKKQENHS